MEKIINKRELDKLIKLGRKAIKNEYRNGTYESAIDIACSIDNKAFVSILDVVISCANLKVKNDKIYSIFKLLGFEIKGE